MSVKLSSGHHSTESALSSVSNVNAVVVVLAADMIKIKRLFKL